MLFRSKNMKKTTLEDVYNVLNEEIGEILVDSEVAENATIAIAKMIERS